MKITPVTRVYAQSPMCDICKNHRKHGSHDKCSKIRQERFKKINEKA